MKKVNRLFLNYPAVLLITLLTGILPANAADLPDVDLRERLGAEIYNRLTGIPSGELSTKQRGALAALAENRGALEQYNKSDDASYKAACEAIVKLYGGGDHPSDVESVQWLVQIKAVSPDLSERIAEIRNRMVFNICEEMARQYGEVHRIDFSPARNALNDIDHTFKVPEFLKALNINGETFVAMFEQTYQEKFGINPQQMDVMSHPAEASIPRWDERIKEGQWKVKGEVHDFVGRLRKGSALLAANDEAYFLEGALRMQVDRRSYESDAELYSIFSSDPHGGDPKDPLMRGGDVARIHVDRYKIRDYQYKYTRPPKMERTYAWGSSMGNWYFAAAHEFKTRFLAKYGLRSFAESVGWFIEYDTSTADFKAPKSYEDMVDHTVQEKLIATAYEKYYGGLVDTYMTVDEVTWTLEKAKNIRNGGENFNPETEFKAEALALARGDEEAFARRKDRFVEIVEQRFRRNMKRLMVENMKVSLPERLADWFDPKVSPYRLGYTIKDLKDNPEGVRLGVEAARKKLRVTALFEILHGLRELDSKERVIVVEQCDWSRHPGLLCTIIRRF
jgi:hypothetical protein